MSERDHGHDHGPTPPVPTGVGRVTVLPGPDGPDGSGDGGWSHLVLPAGLRERLLNRAVFSLLHRERFPPGRGRPHGLLVLAGPPGTGKTTCARGLAHAAAAELADRGQTTLVEIDPHELPSEMLGESQRNVARLFARTLPELAARRRFTVVLVDEVESFAIRRSSASFETNPADLHRATDAVLAGLDRLAADSPRVLFVATTNFLDAVDEAVLSRADAVVRFTLPDRDAAAGIVRDSLAELAELWPVLRALADDGEAVAAVARRCDGLDGRRIRKAVVEAFTVRAETARDPSLLTVADLEAAVDAMAEGVNGGSGGGGGGANDGTADRMRRASLPSGR